MTTPAHRLRPAARLTATCAACGQPMVPLGGGGRQDTEQRQLWSVQ